MKSASPQANGTKKRQSHLHKKTRLSSNVKPLPRRRENQGEKRRQNAGRIDTEACEISKFSQLLPAATFPNRLDLWRLWIHLSREGQHELTAHTTGQSNTNQFTPLLSMEKKKTCSHSMFCYSQSVMFCFYLSLLCMCTLRRRKHVRATARWAVVFFSRLDANSLDPYCVQQKVTTYMRVTTPVGTKALKNVSTFVCSTEWQSYFLLLQKKVYFWVYFCTPLSFIFKSTEFM